MDEENRFSERDNTLARRIQHSFPLEREPFVALARELGEDPDDVLARVRYWERAGLLREISAVLEGATLGYDSALVAAQVPEDTLEWVGSRINEHPTVTHNYVRNHDYNLWFTLAVPHSMGIEPTLDRLSAVTGIAPMWPLRRTHTFKIGVNFDLQAQGSRTHATALPSATPVEPDEHEQRLFRAIQTPLPPSTRPFRIVAAQHGCDEDELLEFARHHLGNAIRRYVATFHHRRVGVRGNGMAVWNVAEGMEPWLGQQLAQAPEVSHCYARNAIEGFPYKVYSMIHGPDRESVLGVARRMSDATGVTDYRVLFSTRELKKCRLRYFLPELDEWWQAHPPRRAGHASGSKQEQAATAVART